VSRYVGQPAFSAYPGSGLRRMIRRTRRDEEGDVARPPDLRQLADEDLIGLVRRGEARAFEVVYNRHADSAFSLAYRMLGTRAAAEEVVQEAFLAVWRSGGRYSPDRGSVRNWLLGIVHHRAVDALRRHVAHQQRRAGDETEIEDRASDQLTDVEAARREQARGVRAALDALPEEQSRVIELAYFGGYTQGEIAELLGVPLGTIKGRARLGLDKLRTALTEIAS
jgi:RNA polymerase sigma-70 factor, ECF subfamily